MEIIIVLLTILFEASLVLIRPQYGIVGLIIIFCLFQVNLGLNVGIHVNVLTLSVVVFVLGTFLRRKVAYDTHYDRKTNITIIIYCIYVLMSSLLGSLSSKYGSDYFRNMIAFIVGFIIVGFIINRMKLDDRDYKFIDYYLFVVIIVIGTYGIINYITKLNPYIAFIHILTDSTDMSSEFLEEERGFLTGRVSSTFIHPLMLGQVSLIMFSYCLYVLKNNIYKPLCIIALGLLLLMCFLCGSRSALVPIAVVIFIYIVYIGKQHLIKYGTIILVVSLCVYFFLPEKKQKVLQGFFFVWDDSYAQEANIQGSNLALRIDQFYRGLGVVEDSPLWGFGQGYVSQHGHDHPEMKGYESYLFQFIVDGGILGVVAFTFFYFRLYFIALRKCKCRFNRYRVHSLCMSYFISILFTGIQGTFIVYILFYGLLKQSLFNPVNLQLAK